MLSFAARLRSPSRYKSVNGDQPGRGHTGAWRILAVARRQHSRAGAARRVFLATLVTLLSLGGTARADGAGEGAEGREGWTVDIRLGMGAATSTYDMSELPVAEYESFVVGGALRLGGFLGPQVLLGFELAVTWGSRVGELRVLEPKEFAQGYPRGSSYGYFAPLGVFIELYPWADEGLFVSASGGVGLLQLPAFSPGDLDAFMARYAFEVGYELSQTGKLGPAVYLHFERWAGEESVLSTDYPDGIVSSQLLAGLRWSL